MSLLPPYGLYKERGTRHWPVVRCSVRDRGRRMEDALQAVDETIRRAARSGSYDDHDVRGVERVLFHETGADFCEAFVGGRHVPDLSAMMTQDAQHALRRFPVS